jgi:hypothetical protein
VGHGMSGVFWHQAGTASLASRCLWPRCDERGYDTISRLVCRYVVMLSRSSFYRRNAMRFCKVDLGICRRNIFIVFVLLCGALSSAAGSRAVELEKAERQPNPNSVRISSEGVSLPWPGRLGKLGEEGVRCLPVSSELEHQISDRLGEGDTYTTACRITESLVVLLAEHGSNGDPLGVLDLDRQGGPIELLRGLPWIERTLKDKSEVLHIVVGGASLRDGLLGSIVSIYSTKTWKQTILTRQFGIDSQDGFLECPEKGGYGYDTTKKVIEEKHRYEDQNGDGSEEKLLLDTQVQNLN